MSELRFLNLLFMFVMLCGCAAIGLLIVLAVAGGDPGVIIMPTGDGTMVPVPTP